MPLSKRHEHEFIPTKRINRIVISTCKYCPLQKSDLIKRFSQEQAATVDAFIERIRNEE